MRLVVIREKKKDIWLIILNLTSILLMSYLLFEMPDMVGKLTLMSHSSPRLMNAVGMINLDHPFPGGRYKQKRF